MCAALGRKISANGRKYALPRTAPVVGVLIDGNEEAYLTAALAAGRMPNWHRITSRTGAQSASYGLVRAVMPTFTNPNNSAVVTGAPPSVNGICGNFFIDEAGKEVMMNDPAFLRCGTILEAAAAAGTPVYVSTAKDKLLKLLTHGLAEHQPETPSFGFSAEYANDNDEERSAAAALRTCFPNSAASTVPELMGYPAPTIYDPLCSIYVLESGPAMLKAHALESNRAPPIMYLSTTDYVQHKYEPEEEEALAFYERIDAAIGALDSLGAIVGVTADHGMNDKTVGGTGGDSPPDVLFVEEFLSKRNIENTTILPITDPYVVHHGALGSFATVHLENTDETSVEAAAAQLRAEPGVDKVLTRAQACDEYELPADRIGDLCVVGGRHTVSFRGTCSNISPSARRTHIQHLDSHNTNSVVRNLGTGTNPRLSRLRACSTAALTRRRDRTMGTPNDQQATR